MTKSSSPRGRRTLRVWTALPMVGAFVLAVGCDGSGTSGQSTGKLQGRITDDGGDRQAGLGGAGTVAASATVRVSAVGAGGALETLVEGKVQAAGAYALDVPAGKEKLVVQALDASGQVLASANLESSGAAGQMVTATPLSAESSLEAAVFLAMLKGGVAVAEADSIDVRARIDARVTAALKAAAKAKGNAEVEIKGLAQGIAAAQRAEIEAASKAGVAITQQALFSAELQAAQSLSAALHGGQSAAAAQADFLAALDAAAEAKGLSAAARARVEQQAGVAFRLVVRGLLDNAGADAKAVAQASVVSGAALQARLTAAAVDSTLKAAGAAQATVDAAAAASATLRSSVEAAADASAVATAYQRFSASIVGTGDVKATVVGTFLGVDAVNAVAAQAAVTATLSAAATLDVALKAAAAALVRADAAVDVSALARAVVEAYATYKVAVDAAAQASLGVFGGKGAASISLLTEATAGFRAGT